MIIRSEFIVWINSGFLSNTQYSILKFNSSNETQWSSRFFELVKKRDFTLKTAQLFTPQEANKTLPLVKNIVKDILKTGRRIRELAKTLGKSFDADPEAQALLAELREHLTELENIGCSYKDFNFSVGLVDFPAIIEDQEVLLCWRSDELEIKYYHDASSGYAGRCPIPKHLLAVE